MFPQMCNVCIFARGIHHDKNMVSAICKHQIIQDSALVICKETIALTINAQIQDIHGDQTFQRTRCRFIIWPAQDHLTHMADIK